MKHFHSSDLTSIVLMREPGGAIRQACAEQLCECLKLPLSCRGEHYSVLVETFVFDGDRFAAHELWQNLEPAEMKVIVGLRTWYKSLEKQFKYRSKEFWTRVGDYVYCNLNTGKCVVFVDAHHWVE